MELKEAFNSNYGATKANDNVLDLVYSARGGATYISFDFLTRMVVTRNGYGDAGLVVTPFSQMDRDVLVAMRDKLVELKGNPPELPAETPANPGAQRQLRP